ncbi:MAG: DUF1175 family protein [Sulfuricella sp.]|nr:DUF1175 family protein [Sulfuricella sp.]
MKRREFLLAALAVAGLAPWAVLSAAEQTPLTPQQSRVFRAWMVRIVSTQLAAGPTPRWQQRDCAGLVRFAVAEALRDHDEKWKRANGLSGQPVPPEISLETAQQSLRHHWRLADGSLSAYAGALEMIQGNTRFQGKDCNQAAPGDLLFFDQGDAQHLMVWMGSFIAYHSGTVAPDDNGLRAVSLRDLLHWRDTRWHPAPDNPNFAGIYRLNFLSA